MFLSSNDMIRLQKKIDYWTFILTAIVYRIYWFANKTLQKPRCAGVNMDFYKFIVIIFYVILQRFFHLHFINLIWHGIDLIIMLLHLKPNNMVWNQWLICLSEYIRVIFQVIKILIYFWPQKICHRWKLIQIYIIWHDIQAIIRKNSIWVNVL